MKKKMDWKEIITKCYVSQIGTIQSKNAAENQ